MTVSQRSFLDGKVVLHPGDCREVLAALPEASVDAIVCDPPYALTSASRNGSPRNNDPETPFGRTKLGERGFMGTAWDTGETAFSVEFWADALRVLKPGGHLVAFSGTRTYHRMACAIEDAGFEIRDQIEYHHDSGGPYDQFVNSLNNEQRLAFMRVLGDAAFIGRLAWTYGAGFPKSLNASRALDGIRCMCGVRGCPAETASGALAVQSDAQARGAWPSCGRCGKPIVPDGLGTALKPATEPICLARKPLIGTVAANVLAHGTGALNIDGCRIESDGGKPRENEASQGRRYTEKGATNFAALPGPRGGDPLGRWPANILHDGSEEVLACFPDAPGQQRAVTGDERAHRTLNAYGDFGATRDGFEPRNDSGSAARFFYTSKADQADRLGSKHPTVKPVDLMQWLVRLVCPKGGVVLDPFAGTGTTGEAAWREGMRAILIEREPEYQADIARRMELAVQPTKRAAVAKTKNKLETPEDMPLFGGGT